MKKFSASIIAVVILISLLVSCVSLQDRPITGLEVSQTRAVGTATVQFQQFKFLHFTGATTIKNKAYTQLLAEARKQYGNDVDVRNIQIKGGFSGSEVVMWAVALGGGLLMDSLMGNFETTYNYYGNVENYALGPVMTVSLFFGTNILGHYEKITATADVVRFGAAVTPAPAPQAAPPVPTGPNYLGLEAALDRAARTLINEMQVDATIATLSVSSNDRDMAAYVLDELEYKLVQARKFSIVDRRQLEQIRAEQNFQLSGDVSDASAVSIGQMLGASIVITGDISSFGTAMRISLRAIDVRTARILTIARESF
jgi:TolB-like protein